MDISELALMVGEVRSEQKQTNELLKDHLKVYAQLDERVSSTEQFVASAKRYSNIIGTVAAGLISFFTLRWFK